MDSITPTPGRRPITALLLAFTALAALPRPATLANDSATTAATAPAGIDRPAPAPRFDDIGLSTGVRLRYAEQGDPAGAPVILLHGYTDSWFSFSRVLPEMPGDWRVLALDQRGHGDSERPGDGYALAALGADVIAFMDALELPRATLVGHSMGSLVAQQVALAAPDRVERLVLIGSATTARNPVVFELAQALAELADPLPAEFVREFQIGTVHVMPPAEFMDEVVATSRRMPLRVWRALINGMLETEPPRRIADRPIPTLILWGEHDAIFSRSDQEALLDLLPGAELVEYKETGHAPHWERPERVARDLGRFLGDAGNG
jgi:pimeloyl-ACP methyl ester carboxylesterase